MTGWFTPDRRRGREILDDPATPDDVRRSSMADVERSNRMFGGTHSALSAMMRIMPSLQSQAVLLDVGTGTGDIPQHAARAAATAGVSLVTLGIDASAALLAVARRRLSAVAAGDAVRLPVRDGAADVVVCSQLMHHFTEAQAIQLVAELHRASRGWVVISDLRRSWLAAAAFWTASVALRFHRVTRHDGVVSVLRGFTPAEVEQLVMGATGVRPVVRRNRFWRITATWSKHGV